MPLSDTLNDVITDHYFATGAGLSGDPDLYLGLSRATVNPDGTGVDEPNASDGYARVSVGASSAVSWAIDSEAYARNQTVIEFPVASASWGTIVDVFLTTVPTVGGAIDRFISTLIDPLVVAAAQRPQFLVDDLVFGTYAAGSPVKRYSTAYTDTQVLNSVLNGIVVPFVPTYAGIHAYPLIVRPDHDGTFGEYWDYLVGPLNYGRQILSKASTVFDPRWERPKTGEVQNLQLFDFHPGGGGAQGSWTAFGGNMIILDSAGVDPGYTGGPILPAGSGGGNLLFFVEGPVQFISNGDIVRCLAGDLDLTFD